MDQEQPDAKSAPGSARLVRASGPTHAKSPGSADTERQVDIDARIKRETWQANGCAHHNRQKCVEVVESRLEEEGQFDPGPLK